MMDNKEGEFKGRKLGNKVQGWRLRKLVQQQ